jgi:hypothetical protein
MFVYAIYQRLFIVKIAIVMLTYVSALTLMSLVEHLCALYVGNFQDLTLVPWFPRVLGRLQRRSANLCAARLTNTRPRTNS